MVQYITLQYKTVWYSWQHGCHQAARASSCAARARPGTTSCHGDRTEVELLSTHIGEELVSTDEEL